MTELEGTVVVTGGTSGIGLECARVLAATPGLTVVITGRDQRTVQARAAEVGARGLVLDLGSLASLDRFVQELRAAGLPPLRALVCNAGLQFTRRALTADGVEATFGVNHLGHIALVEGLVDVLVPPARIVLLSSGTHDPALPSGLPDPLPDRARALAYPPPRSVPGDSAARDGRRRYATSKLANVRTAYALARRLQPRGITVNAFDPGLVPGTGLARDANPVARLLFRALGGALVVLPGVNTARTSGANLARLVTDPALDRTTGAYVAGLKPIGSSLASYDQVEQDALYEDSLGLIAELRAASASARSAAPPGGAPPPHEHGPAGVADPPHVHDEACAAAHGIVVPPPDPRRLVLVFASPVAGELAALAGRLGWPVTLVEPDPGRLDGAGSGDAAVGSVAAAELDDGCDVVVCDHERPELGDVLAAVLAGRSRWLGVIGSRRHVAPHVAALQDRGLPAEQIARVHRPIGLDIGSHTPAEIAISTVAGLLADRNGRPGGPFPAAEPPPPA